MSLLTQGVNPIQRLILAFKGATESEVDVQRRLKSFISFSVYGKLGILLLGGKMDESFESVSSLKVHEGFV